MPPCPGRSLPKSLIPKFLLIVDAARSPNILITERQTLIIITETYDKPVSPSKKNFLNTKSKTTFNKTAPTTPPIAPSTLFLGLILGQSLRLPNLLPTK